MNYAFPSLSVAAITPFTQAGDLDWEAVEPLTRHLIDQGNKGIVISGTTGESPCLSKTEYFKLIEVMSKAANGDAMIVVGAGTNSTWTTVELIEEVRKTNKADAIMTVAPYYNRPNQEGLFQHFSEAAKAAGDLPLLVYNIPARTGCEIEPETLLRLTEISNVRGVKDAVGNLEKAAWLIARAPETFGVYSGDDSKCMPLLSVGGAGLISVASHVVGPQIAAMISAYEQGDTATARSLHLALHDVFKALFVEPNPTPVKYALSKTGIVTDTVRLPLVAASQSARALIDKAMEPFTA